MPTTAEQAQEQEQQAQQKANARRKISIAHGFDLVAGTFDSVNGPFFDSLGTRLVQLAGVRPGDRVLDLGCGRGAVLLAAAQAVGPDGYAAGIDLSPAMVQATAAEIGRRGLRNVAVRVDDAEDPGFPAGSFEAVLAGLMMFVTPDPAAALAAAHRVLAPGGRFAMTTFGPADPDWERPMRAALAFQDPPPQQQPQLTAGAAAKGGNGLLDTPEAIAAMLDRARFSRISTVEEESVTVTDPDRWWASVWSSGRRAALELIPVDRREDARKAALAALEPLAVDGVLTRRSLIRYTTATRE